MERDKYFSIFFNYIVFARNVILSFPPRLRRKYVLLVRNKPYLSPFLKIDHSLMSLELKPMMGKLHN